MKKTFYEILGIAPDSSAEAIRDAYQQAIARLDAQAQPGDEDARNRRNLLKDAYSVLSDPGRKAMYDVSLREPPAPVGGIDDEPFSRRHPRWRHWVLGGTAAVVLLVAGSIVIGFARWKPAPKVAAPPAAPSVAVVVPAKDPPAPEPVLSAERIFEQHSRSVAVVLGFDATNRQVAQGSGVVIEPQRVVTNCHVVRNAETIKVWQSARTYDARLEFGDTDPTRDLCQLFAPGLDAPAVPLGDSRKLKVGKRVFALGAPLGLELTLSEGIVSGLRAHQDAAYVQVTAPISPGSSGGALFDEAGELVGITTFGALIGQNVNFAVPVEWVKDLPNRPRTPFLPRGERP